MNATDPSGMEGQGLHLVRGHDPFQPKPTPDFDLPVRDAVSRDRITTLHPTVQKQVTRMINQVKYGEGVTLRVAQATRTDAEQNALYAQGRTTPGPIVTNARGGESYHNYGLAVDVFAMNEDGTMDWRAAQIDGGQSRIADYGRANGLEWGGSFGDRPHFDNDMGMTVDQLAVARTNVQNAMNYISSLFQNEEDQ